jgi:hypothetical protein
MPLIAIAISPAPQITAAKCYCRARDQLPPIYWIPRALPRGCRYLQNQHCLSYADRAHKQDTVTTSFTEDELFALSQANKPTSQRANKQGVVRLAPTQQDQYHGQCHSPSERAQRQKSQLLTPPESQLAGDLRKTQNHVEEQRLKGKAVERDRARSLG